MKCLVGMSGGVDSSVTAALMKKKYNSVIGCTFRMIDSENTENSIFDAKKVADLLKIRHIVVDCRENFKNLVMDNFINMYKNGYTPNPCVICNKFVKFQLLNELREQYNVDVLATGHYAILKKINDKIELHQADFLEKDQSYFLYKLNQDILKYLEFPLGSLNKSKTREIARDFGIHVSDKLESQDICFIPNGNYVSFLKKHLSYVKHGEITTEKGEVLGFHKGTINYTVGQRKGLGLSGGPFFVKKIDAKNNRIVVSNIDNLKKDIINLVDVNFINEEYIGECEVKIRSANRKYKAEIIKEKNEFYVQLLEPIFGIAKGQHCVFYNNTKVLGGGIIC